jgi:formylglycine-generating enzyme required for sulfatase activity
VAALIRLDEYCDGEFGAIYGAVVLQVVLGLGLSSFSTSTTVVSSARRYYRRCLVIALVLFSHMVAVTASAQIMKTLAVLEFSSDTVSGVSLTERKILADNTRGIAREKLSASRWIIMTRDNMQLMVKPGTDLANCEGECAIETGRTLQASYLITGTLGKLGERLQVNVSLYDVASANLVGTARARGATINQVVDPLEEELGKLFATLGEGAKQDGIKSAQATSPVTTPDPEMLPDFNSNEFSVSQHSKALVDVAEGCFEMGSLESFFSPDHESPKHTVCLNGFQIDAHEVTNIQYEACVEAGACTAPFRNDGRCLVYNGFISQPAVLPKEFRGKNQPVVCVDWDQAQRYCNWMGGRLPTEAEWEYAARAGTSTRFFWGNSKVGDYAWYSGNSMGKTHPVGQKLPNAWGLHDVSGNVWEWTGDWYHPDYYDMSPRENPQGPESGKERVMRGGSRLVQASGLRLAGRATADPESSGAGVGFRCVIPAVQNLQDSP